MISVIIPATKGREENLKLTLAGLLAQTFPKDMFDITVVYDGDIKDVSPIFDDSIFSEVNLISIDKKDGWNASIPRNAGVKATTQPYLLFLDSDVVLNPKALAEYAFMVKINDNRVIIGRYDWLPPMYMTIEDIMQRFDQFRSMSLAKKVTNYSLGYQGNDMRKVSFEKQTKPDMTFDTIFDSLACFGGNLLVPRKIFEECGGFDESMRYGIEDGDFGLTLHEHGIVFSYCEAAVGYHNWHPLSAERSMNAGAEVKKLNAKHFPDETAMNISYATGIAYKRWGFEWYPPEWETMSEEDKQAFVTKVRTHEKN